MWCEGKEEKVVWKSLGMLIYRATLLLSQSARVAGTRAKIGSLQE